MIRIQASSRTLITSICMGYNSTDHSPFNMASLFTLIIQILPVASLNPYLHTLNCHSDIDSNNYGFTNYRQEKVWMLAFKHQ